VGDAGHPGYTGYAWYRRHLILLADTSADWTMTLFLPNVEDACDVYWNGIWVSVISVTRTAVVGFEAA
jgi:hypothetical protein